MSKRVSLKDEELVSYPFTGETKGKSLDDIFEYGLFGFLLHRWDLTRDHGFISQDAQGSIIHFLG